MDTTYTNPNANYFQPGQGGNPLPANLPAPSTSTMSADKITQPSTLNLQSQTPTPIPDITNITSTQAATAPTPVTPTPTTPSIADRLTSSISNLFGQSKNKEADLQSQINQEQAPYAQQLNEINTQIKMQQAKALANQEAAARSGETTGFASREQQNIARTDAIETLKLSAIAEGLQGNLALAEKHATNAINAKYSDINKQIEDAKTNIYNNYDSFSPAEKKKADQTLLRLDAQDAFAKQNQDNEKAVQGIIQTAITQGQTNGVPVPNAILQKASQLTDPTQAVQMLAPYLKDAAAIQKTIDDHNYSIAQTAVAKANLAKIKAEDVKSPEVKTINGVDMQWNPKTQKWENISVGPNPSSNDVTDKLAFLKQTAKDALTVSDASGRSGMRRGFESVVYGATDYTKLVSLANTLQTNALTLATDPNIKKFFGPNMSNNDVKLMMSAGTTLNPELQAPEDLRLEVNRLLNVFDKLENIAKQSNSPTVTVNGTQYIVGQVYNDGTANWTVDASGNWTKQ